MKSMTDRQIIAKRFAELPRDLAAKIKVAIFEIGWQEWHNLDAMTRIQVLRFVRRREQRRADGRYSLEEAIQIIARHAVAPDFPRDDAEKIDDHLYPRKEFLRKILDSARAGSLRSFRPGQLVPLTPDQADTSTWLSRETYWHDLNSWLVSNAPEISFRFPELTGGAVARASRSTDCLESRNAQIRARFRELEAKKVPNFNKVLAREFGLSESTIKKIRKAEELAGSEHVVNSPFSGGGKAKR
jgi:hypothetical protein